jgi:hypothetical protein
MFILLSLLVCIVGAVVHLLSTRCAALSGHSCAQSGHVAEWERST